MTIERDSFFKETKQVYVSELELHSIVRNTDALNDY